PQHPAGNAEYRRFDGELRHDFRAPRTKCAPDADFLRPLGDSRQHDVHDPDAADDEGEKAGAAEDDIEGSLRPEARAQELARDDARRPCTWRRWPTPKSRGDPWRRTVRAQAPRR